jgi:hypothetical protein
MATFKDNAGREWPLKVTVDGIERVREIDVDLADVSAVTLQRLLDDDVLLVRSLWLLIEVEADKLGVKPKQFGESMCGQPLEDAFDALREAIDLFFPPRKRGFWREAVKATLADQAESLKMGMEALKNTKTKTKMKTAKRKRIEAEIEKTLSRLNSVTDSPDSSASTPGP